MISNFMDKEDLAEFGLLLSKIYISDVYTFIFHSFTSLVSCLNKQLYTIDSFCSNVAFNEIIG